MYVCMYVCMYVRMYIYKTLPSPAKPYKTPHLRPRLQDAQVAIQYHEQIGAVKIVEMFLRDSWEYFFLFGYYNL